MLEGPFTRWPREARPQKSPTTWAICRPCSSPRSTRVERSRRIHSVLAHGIPRRLVGFDPEQGGTGALDGGKLAWGDRDHVHEEDTVVIGREVEVRG